MSANTDRHYENISLLLKDDNWYLSPTYDMLPMLYAPINGELLERLFTDRPLYPTAATLTEWPAAKDLAAVFRRAAAAHALISEDFKAIAVKNLKSLLVL